MPVECDETVFADGLAARQIGEQLVNGNPCGFGLFVVHRRDAVFDEPAEDVTDPALAGFVPPQSGDDATVDDPAHPRHLVQLGGVHDMARRGTHDGYHLAGLDRAGRRGGHVSINVAHSHGDAFG